jgi:hypothetical protein
MGDQNRDRNHSLPQNNLTHYSEENEENRYPVPDSNETEINDAKEPNVAHKNTVKEEILQVITENFMEMLLDMVNQSIKEISRQQK